MCVDSGRLLFRPRTWLRVPRRRRKQTLVRVAAAAAATPTIATKTTFTRGARARAGERDAPRNNRCDSSPRRHCSSRAFACTYTQITPLLLPSNSRILQRARARADLQGRHVCATRRRRHMNADSRKWASQAGDCLRAAWHAYQSTSTCSAKDNQRACFCLRASSALNSLGRGVVPQRKSTHNWMRSKLTALAVL